MPLQQTSGNDTADAYGGGAAAVINYIEDVFSTWLYTGTAATQTITNGIDLAGKGGLVWIKNRTTTYNHVWEDTSRGLPYYLASNTTSAQVSLPTGITSFNANGFSIGAAAAINNSSDAIASWTFRKQPKFFDVVTYTGNSTNRTIAHNLGSVPGTIIVKRTNTTGDWVVYHRSLGATKYIILNSTGAAGTYSGYWNDTEPTDSVFSLSGTSGDVNGTGNTYVAYLFAHNAGGFGLTGTDNVISCGSFTTDGSGAASVTLGYEPQWILYKPSSAASDWIIVDSMRAMPVTSGSAARLYPNGTYAEGVGNSCMPNATGFTTALLTSTTYVYIAIRRGPMKVPTDGTKVFYPNARTGTGATATITGIGFTPDLYTVRSRSLANDSYFADRLRGTAVSLISEYTFDEASVATSVVDSFNMNGATIPNAGAVNNQSAATYIDYFFQRAPGFFDEVCYTGTGANATISHNLQAVPELMIVKGRSGATAWQVYSSALANTEYLVLNTTAAKATGTTRWNSTTPTSSVFSIGTATEVNTSAATYVAYLFATCVGVSKVGTYTGTGATQTINCGFTGGARFVMIKKTSATGDWWFWDTARGMVSGTDPRSAFDLSTAETNANWVYTATTGFQIVTTDTSVNANGATYIFLAIA